MKAALIVFAKAPVPGEVKTRLLEVLAEEEAARLYEAFLYDALEQYGSLPVSLRLYEASASDGQSIDGPPDASHVLQKGNSLGERMRRAFRETFAEGYERVVIVGTDHPTLPTAFLEKAFADLRTPDSICIGPSDDGGYYLLGMNAYRPELFSNMRYSHPRVFDETMIRMRDTGARLTILPLWYDVDTPEDLSRLEQDLQENPHVPLRRTRDVLGQLAREQPGLFVAG